MLPLILFKPDGENSFDKSNNTTKIYLYRTPTASLITVTCDVLIL